MKKIILVGGGTGGHLFPAVGVAQRLGENPEYKAILITDERCRKYLKNSYNGSYNFEVNILNIKSYKKSFLSVLAFVLNNFKIAYQIINIYLETKPDVVIGFGSYVSFMPLAIAKILGVKIILNEQNCFLGKVNKMFARSAKFLTLSFEKTKNLPEKINNSLVIGNIVRKEFLNLDIKRDFYKNELNVLVLGGSQGAAIFNDLIPEVFRIISEKIKDKTKNESEVDQKLEINLVQQSSKQNFDLLTKKFNQVNQIKINFRCNDFFHDIISEYIKADLIICRSGASTIAEIIEAGLPAIMIPYKFAAENHQYYNAKVVEDAGGGWCFEENKLSAQILADKILELIVDRKKLEDASKKIKSLSGDSMNKMLNLIYSLENKK
jgi:UDP-N-acetylglucosamine--N-acetylmuramyl-(pentapeptide) pyrophosphoryl-undecaprenol N-acetylglucosamine transferase